jgi:hypothetical protein
LVAPFLSDPEKMIRRLPVVQSDAPPSRPRYQWVLIAAGFTITLWLPLVALALALSRFAASSPTFGQSSWSLVPLLLSYVIANAGSAALMQRFAGEAARLATLLGPPLATLAVLLVALLGGVGGRVLFVGAAVLLLGGGLGAFVGTWLAKKRY